MKLALVFTLAASASAFSPATSRREAMAAAGAAVGAAIVPLAANAAAGESPRFSVFGLIGDGTSYSEGAAYGTDQSQEVYSPYSPYSPTGEKSLYKAENPEYAARKKAVLAETRKRLQKIPGYVDKKKWFEVYNELGRYMYETRGAAKELATTPAQKKAATEFFKSIEKTDLAARRRNQELAASAAADSIAKLDAFTATL
ncbi:hypothetical protein MPSEU_000659700 [Mayamaea pseudoterrestris]|nr:hypothetical protein MPSEU_000659700 [Mayamaea pseudoterrestris]